MNENNNIFLFTATLTEAKPILNLSNSISETYINKIKIRTFDRNNLKINVIRTGIGSKITKAVLNAVADFVKNGIIINIGTAGALNNKLQIGDWISINKIFSNESDETIKIEHCDTFPSASILTSSAEITNEELKQEKHKRHSADLVDMEAFHIADFAEQKIMPCYVIKMVSDYANEGTNTISALKGTMKIHYNPHAANIFLKIINKFTNE